MQSLQTYILGVGVRQDHLPTMPTRSTRRGGGDAAADPERAGVVSPTQRSLAYLRKAGYTVAVVEKWNHITHTRADLWGFGDLLAFHEQRPVMIVQVTSATNLSARRQKLLRNETAKKWVQSGGELVLHSWALRGARGERKTWTPAAEWLEVDQFTHGGDDGEGNGG